jgi:EAL domain-containing protein (putative c-di-GMP-specific phosphodiesterase class I)
VETEEQIALLRGYGCQEVQGFHYWGPMPANEMRQLVMPVSGGIAGERVAVIAGE